MIIATITHPGITDISIYSNTKNTHNIVINPSNILPSYLHLYYMKSKSKNQPKSKNNF